MTVVDLVAEKIFSKRKNLDFRNFRGQKHPCRVHDVKIFLRKRKKTDDCQNGVTSRLKTWGRTTLFFTKLPSVSKCRQVQNCSLVVPLGIICRKLKVENAKIPLERDRRVFQEGEVF